MTNFELIALILTATALAGYVNHRFIRLPNAIGLMAASLLLSLSLCVLGKIGVFDQAQIGLMIQKIDFSNIMMHGMLSFLLFAGAMHVNLADLRKVRGTVALLATGGVVLAVLMTSSLVWLASSWLGVALPFEYALLFGALIAPTDPIAVLGILKDAKVARRLYMKIGGESLFNDGTGVVIFTMILNMATAQHAPTLFGVAALFGREVFGGAALGFMAGWLTTRLIRSAGEYKVEVLLTLALVTGGYALAEVLHVSGPIAMVVAGLFVGNHGRARGSADLTHKQLDAFWEMLDEILNAVLFMLIGMQMILLTMTSDMLLLGVAAIAAVLIGRFVSVTLLVGGMGLWRRRFERGTIALLTWGALRGGISIAMALSLPSGPGKDLVLDMTYIVVVFSIMVQGTSFSRVIRWATRPPPDM